MYNCFTGRRDWPAKRQKKPSCVSIGMTGHGVWFRIELPFCLDGLTSSHLFCHFCFLTYNKRVKDAPKGGKTEILMNLELESRNGNVDGQTNGQTNMQNYTNFERNLAMMVIYLPAKLEFDWKNRFQVGVRKRKF